MGDVTVLWAFGDRSVYCRIDQRRIYKILCGYYSAERGVVSRYTYTLSRCIKNVIECVATCNAILESI